MTHRGCWPFWLVDVKPSALRQSFSVCNNKVAYNVHLDLFTDDEAEQVITVNLPFAQSSLKNALTKTKSSNNHFQKLRESRTEHEK